MRPAPADAGLLRGGAAAAALAAREGVVSGRVDLGGRGGPRGSPGEVHLSGPGDARWSAPLAADGGFAFFDVPPGEYVLDAHVKGFVFPRVRVEAGGGLEGEARASLLDFPGRLFKAPLVLPPVGEAAYEERKSEFFSLKTLTKNPVYVMIGLVAVFGLLAPKLVDPEALAEAQREMAGVKQPPKSRQEARHPAKRE